jgi:hypothetical protein
MHDTHEHKWIPPTKFHLVTGTWTMTAGAVANTIAMSRAQADASTTITIPVDVPMNDGPEKGAYLVSVDVYWECLTAANDAVDALIHKVTLPLNTVAIGAPESLAFSYDTGHDTAGERLTLDQHSMTLTLTTPLWVEDDVVVQVQIIINAAATSDITLFGARANYTYRLG